MRLKSNFCEQTGNIDETYVSFRVLGLVVSVETGLRLRGRLWEVAALHRSLRPSGLGPTQAKAEYRERILTYNASQLNGSSAAAANMPVIRQPFSSAHVSS